MSGLNVMAPTIERLEKQIASTDLLLGEYEAKTLAVPGDFALEMSTVSLRERLADLQEQLREEKALRGKEVVELRFKGFDERDTGTLPLDLLGVVSHHFSHALSAASRFIKTGTVGGAIPRDIIEMLDLRAAALAHGSTRFFVTGNTAPDFFGRSLLEESLKDTFTVLFSRSPEDLTDAVASIGAPAAKSVKKLLEEIGGARLHLDMRWNTPSDEELVWHADPQEMLQLANSLAGLIQSEPESIDLAGEVETVSSKRMFELRTDQGESLAAKVPQVLREALKALRVGQRVEVTIDRQIVTNQVTGAEKVIYTLRQVVGL